MTNAKKPPPVPPAGRSNKGPAEAREKGARAGATAGAKPASGNLDEQGRQGNIRQNTTNTGLQQDR